MLQLSKFRRNFGNSDRKQLTTMKTRFTPRGPADLSPLGNLPGWFSALLRLRGVHTEEEARRFLSPSLEDLNDPFLLPGMDKAVRLIRDAVAAGDRIMIFGDYDADGVCATSILLETLTELGAQVSFRLPSRHADGYGLNEGVVRETAEKAKLLITVDCGISNPAEVALAKSLGLTVIVTDHHQLPEELPPADAILEPLLGDYPCPHLCGAGVALKLCQALQGTEGVEKRLDLAAIATVADVVPLLDENRVIVREGLRRLNAARRPGLKAMLELSGTTPPLRADDLGFRIAPRLNAAGRLGDAGICVRLLLTGREETARTAAQQLESMNRERQAQEREITAAALSQAAGQAGDPESRVIMASGDGWNPGLIGLTAGRLCERFYRPAVVLSVPEDGGPVVGSCRSVPGIHLFETLQACSDLLIRFGGHAQAAGLAIARENIPALRERMDEVLKSRYPEECFRRELPYDLSVPFGMWTEETLSLLNQLEPTGCGNPAPAFLLPGASIQTMRRVGRDGAHLQITALDGDNTFVRAIAFSQGDAADRPLPDADLLYTPTVNRFNGRTSIEAQVLAINECN